LIRAAKGYRQSRSKLYVNAKDTLEKAMFYAYRDRRAKKRTFRALWIVRINAAAHENGLSYGQFIHGLKVHGIDLDRKVLAEIAVQDSAGFARLAQMVKA